MKILFSPAKEMNLTQLTPMKSDVNYNAVFEALQSKSDAELKALCKLDGDALAQNIANIRAPKGTAPALALYHGLAYRTMDHAQYVNHAYLDKHLLIFSALFGPISPQTQIFPYRLDLTMGLKVDGQSLKTYWKQRLADIVPEGTTLWNLASNEFGDLFSRKTYDVLDFEFYERKDGTLKKHSTISKKGRGLMVKYCADHRIDDVDGLKDFDLDGYRFCVEKSTDNTLVFVKDVL